MKLGLRKYFVLFFLFIAISGLFVFFIAEAIAQREQSNRAINLEIVNRRAVNEVRDALENFATLLSGLRSHIRYSEEFPSERELQQFLQYQIEQLRFDDSIIISYVDTTHYFRYSFTPYTIDPSGLKNTAVQDIVGTDGIQRLEMIMNSDDYYAYPPYNLVEGKVGFPVNFGVIINGRSLGYVSAITDFKPVIDRVYNRGNAPDFVFSFQTIDGYDFDRERVYDGSTIYNNTEDPEFYKNYDKEEADFIYTRVPYYNTVFRIGTAYKEPYQRNPWISLLLAVWYASLILFLVFALRQLYLYRLNTIQIEQQRAELDRLSKTRNRFFSIVAHDIKNPMAAIMMLIGLLKGEEFKKESTKKIVRGLSDATKSTMTLLDNILDWSKLERGEMTFQPEALSLYHAVEGVLEMLRISLELKNLEAINRVSPEVTIHADPNMIATILRNLISNSIKFTQSGGKISISHREEQAAHWCCVQDNGVGMAPEELKNLFEVTTTISKLGTNDEKGTGLGLVLCKEFVDKHQGEITIESELQQGTTICFSIPKRSDQ
ncbi:ATP-binding protein [Croceiramulus getboli]|nr:HAMP domain-containing sensor histidine kinase [Flavobacteriaceae bacterium YJPT1-3]